MKIGQSHPSQLSTTTAASPEEAVEQQQQPQQKVTSSSTASHGEVDDECPSLAPNREGIADQSGPGNTTLCPPDIHADAMLDTVSVSATPTDSFIDGPSTSQSGPGQTYAPTAAMGTGSLPATPPVQPDTAAYTQVGPMDPSHSRPFIDNQLGPRYPGQDPQAPAPTEPQYTGQPTIDSQHILPVNVDAMHTRVPYRHMQSVDTEVSHSVPLTKYMLDVCGRQSMSPVVHMPGMQADMDTSMYGSHTQSALRDVDPSHPAYTHIPCRKEEAAAQEDTCLLYTSPSPRDRQKSRMPSSA